MKDANELFIKLFEKIVSEVNRRAGAQTSHTFEIERAAAKDPTIQSIRHFLMYVRDVRNTLQHPKHSSRGHAIHVTDGFLTEVNAALDRLCNPVTASAIGVALRDIEVARPSDTLGALADVMKRNAFSHMPILNDTRAVTGVFNEAAVFEFLWSEQETIIGKDMRLSDILRHCALNATRTETFSFVRPGTPRDEIAGMFKALGSPSTRLGAVFVTASGKGAEPLQRMITAWDVLATED